MAYAFINQVTAGSPDGDGFASGSVDMTGADILIVVCAAYTTNESGIVIQDSSSNTYTPRSVYSVAADIAVRVWDVEAPTVTNSMVFSVAGVGATFASIVAFGFSGSAATANDQENGANTSSGTSLQPGSITPSENNELVIAGAGFGGAITSPVIDLSFIGSGGVNTVYHLNYGSGTHQGIAAAYKIQTTAAEVNPTFSWTGAVSSAATQRSYKGPGGGGARFFILTGH